LECGSPHGVGRQIAELCEHLHREKFELWVVYSVRPGFTPEEFEKLTHKAHRHVYIPEMVRPVHPLKDLLAFWKLYRLIRKEKPDVVHAHSSKAGVLARLAARLAGVKKIYYSPHGYSFLMTDVSSFSRGLYRGFELSVSWIGHVISTSKAETEAARSLSWGKEVFHVDKLFSMEEDFQGNPSSADGAVTIGALGRLSYARQPEAFIRLAKELSRKCPQARFVWIGGGEMESSILELARNQGLDSRVEFTGHIPRKAVLARLRQMDIFIHYSRWDSSPVAIQEAMYFAKPVIASDISGNRDLVIHGETGYLAKDENELCEYVSRLIESAALRTEMGAKGRDRLRKEFALEKSVEALERLYL